MVVLMGVTAEDYPAVLRLLFRLTNIRCAMVTMPHKGTTAGQVDELSATARIAGSLPWWSTPAASVRRSPHRWRRVGSPISRCSTPTRRPPTLTRRAAALALSGARGHHRFTRSGQLRRRGECEADGDPLPQRLGPGSLVGEVVMREHHTPFLRAALVRGCDVQVGTDMLFEQIPACLEFFGFGTARTAQGGSSQSLLSRPRSGLARPRMTTAPATS
jgi:shikimate dehydrogenase